jgi:multisubunit Na+/H+ antiporter MnhE subunit
VSPFTIAKLALMLVAAVLLAWGIRTDDSALRWAGIGFLFAALVLRFFKPRKPRGL